MNYQVLKGMSWSLGRILYCMVARLLWLKEWMIGRSLIIGHVSYWKKTPLIKLTFLVAFELRAV